MSDEANSGSDRSDTEDALRRALHERDAVLRDAEQSEPDALREERVLAGYREIARSTPVQPSDMEASQESSDSRAPSWVGSIRWRSIVGLAAAALIAAVALWDLDREDPGGGDPTGGGPEGTDVRGMRTLGDPSGIHVAGGVLRWPVFDARANYTVRFEDPTGAVSVEVIHSDRAEVRLPESFRSMPEFEVTVRSKSESGEVSIRTEVIRNNP